MEFSLDGEEEDERVENIPIFWYMGISLDQTDDDWPSVWRNIMHSRLVCGRLGTLLRWEGEDTKTLESLYREVVQAILLYGLEAWVLLTSMSKRLEGTHTELLKLIMGKRVRSLGDRTWETLRTGGRGKSVGEDIHRVTSGNRGAVGGATSLI